MLDVLLSNVLHFVVSYLPGFLIKRFIGPEQVKNSLEIDLRSDAPVDISFGSQIPTFSVWLRCTNKSSVPLEIDRILIEIWVSQPIVEGAILRPAHIPPKETRELFFRSGLSGQQQAAIKGHAGEGGLLNVPLTLNIEAYCNSKVGSFNLRVHKTHNPAVVKGIPRPPRTGT